ncbi:superfamily II DNA and RNA helicases [Geminocystis sp. NIES-3708]|uniref:hypothetical protein n=1 Tax=Geminocystis sp. NIES-3708 TaxID=1615909 RepID=UPI0005FC7C9C|nr:hypothetical protein [Geminocystis sp. NIES-3708]BAQ60756.1 superfamily II DNA and RNA helicases [Geminocystis sp. NIES-3708]
MVISFNPQLRRKTVATISIQSLNKLNEKNDTLKYLEKIFDSAYNRRENQVIPSKMSAIASRFKHFFIMIDEITEDSSGVEFLSGV